MPIYNKLIRDYIPEIIEKSGKSYQTRTLTENEYIAALKEKLKEETAELSEAGSKEDAIEEAADLLEVLHALAAAKGTSMEEIEKARQQKREERGGFDKRIFLLEVEA